MRLKRWKERLWIVLQLGYVPYPKTKPSQIIPKHNSMNLGEYNIIMVYEYGSQV